MKTTKTQGYPKYAIYSGSVRYDRELMSYDLKGKWDRTDRCANLPRHRIRDRSDWNGWIYREDPGSEVVLERLREVWRSYLSDPDCQRSPEFVPRNPQNVEHLVELVEQEEWVLTWFSHQTCDVGQTDAEALDSFQRFLDRKGVRMNYGYDRYLGCEIQKDDYCAMGAEDRWRWSGANDNHGNNTPPPCRCEGCKKAGMIRINH